MLRIKYRVTTAETEPANADPEWFPAEQEAGTIIVDGRTTWQCYDKAEARARELHGPTARVVEEWIL